MIRTLFFSVPGVPQGKGRPRFVRKTGMAFTPARTRSYEAEIKHFALERWGDASPMVGALRVRVVAYLPVPQSWSKRKRADALAGTVLPTARPDVDNYAKAVCDALNELVYRDDSQVVELVACKAYCERPRLDVFVDPIDDPERAAA